MIPKSAPVSTPKSAVGEPPLCDFCGAETDERQYVENLDLMICARCGEDLVLEDDQ